MYGYDNQVSSPNIALSSTHSRAKSCNFRRTAWLPSRQAIRSTVATSLPVLKGLLKNTSPSTSIGGSPQPLLSVLQIRTQTSLKKSAGLALEVQVAEGLAPLTTAAISSPLSHSWIHHHLIPFPGKTLVLLLPCTVRLWVGPVPCAFGQLCNGTR